MTYRTRFFSAKDGLQLAFRDYGDPLSPRCPVLCLPGLTRNAKDFAEVAKRLAPARRVIVLDYRGRGQSAYDKEWRNYRPEVYVDDIHQLVALANLHRSVVFGTSMGGLLAMGLAVALPGLLAGVVLNDVGPELPKAAVENIVELMAAAKPQPDWPTAIACLQDSLPNLSFSGRTSWQSFAAASYRQGEDGQLYPDWDMAILRALQKQGDPPSDLWHYFRALRRIPTLAVRGEHSDFFSLDCLKKMATEKPDLRQISVPGTGHAPALDEAAVEAAIDELLEHCDEHYDR